MLRISSSTQQTFLIDIGKGGGGYLTKTVCTSFPVATAMEKMEKPKDEINIGFFLPNSSDIGAQSLRDAISQIVSSIQT